MTTIFKQSVPGREGVWPRSGNKQATDFMPVELLRAEPAGLPQVSELVVRHFTRLSQKNFGVDGNFYPLGSCTMKYNPKFCEQAAALPGFSPGCTRSCRSLRRGAASARAHWKSCMKPNSFSRSSPACTPSPCTPWPEPTEN